MDACSAVGVAPNPLARLLIHTDNTTQNGASRLAQMLRRLPSFFAFDSALSERASVRLHIDYMQGRRLLAIQDASPVIDVPLAAGTYQVTARLGKVQRGYTVALAPGAIFDLHLSLAPEHIG